MSPEDCTLFHFILPSIREKVLSVVGITSFLITPYGYWYVQAGLLAPGSSYSPAFPIVKDQWLDWLSCRLQRRVHSRFSRDSLLSLAGPVFNATVYTIKDTMSIQIFAYGKNNLAAIFPVVLFFYVPLPRSACSNRIFPPSQDVDDLFFWREHPGGRLRIDHFSVCDDFKGPALRGMDQNRFYAKGLLDG